MTEQRGILNQKKAIYCKVLPKLNRSKSTYVYDPQNITAQLESMANFSIERNLQRNLRGMTLTNYRTVGDVRAIRKCERANGQIDRTQDLLSRMYESDLKTAHLQVEYSQKMYAGQLMRIENDRFRASNESHGSSLSESLSPRQKIVSRNTLKRVLDNLNEPQHICKAAEKETEERVRKRAHRVRYYTLKYKHSPCLKNSQCLLNVTS